MQSRGEVTRQEILKAAVKMASTHGIGGITIGELAKSVGMSKSGLFAHFGAKDMLQIDVLKMAEEKFIDKVLKPSLSEARGLPRIEAMFENWMSFLKGSSDFPGGSIFIAASIELDDQPGPLRDYVKESQLNLLGTIAKAAEMAIDEGHFAKGLDTKQFAWELYSYVLGYHHSSRLLDDPEAQKYLRISFEELIKNARGLSR